jgi:hypothetical protein
MLTYFDVIFSALFADYVFPRFMPNSGLSFYSLFILSLIGVAVGGVVSEIITGLVSRNRRK